MSEMLAWNYSAFFEPLVGTPEATQDFYRKLARAARCGKDNPKRGGPYARLSRTLGRTIREYAPRIASGERISPNVLRNIEIGIVKLTVGTLSAVGGLYMQHARDEHGEPIPQHKSGVQRNTAHALGFALSLANRDSRTSLITVHAAQAGADPNGPQYAGEAAPSIESWDESLEGAFKVTRDEKGQVALSLRYSPRRTTYVGRRCPATDERLKTGEPSLGKCVWVIGQVAVDKIFPHQFVIVSDADFHGRLHPVEPAGFEQGP